MPTPNAPPTPKPDPDVIRSCKVIKSQTSTVPVTINADDLNEFLTKVSNIMGDPHLEAEFSGEEVGSGPDGRDLKLTVDTKITVPKLGMSRATDAERDAMQRAIKFIKEHEERHRKIANDSADRACQVKGMSIASARAKSKAVICKDEPAHQAELDAKEGTITPVQDQKTGRVTDFRKSGASRDYSQTNCTGVF
jgi:hypothetical protein